MVKNMKRTPLKRISKKQAEAEAKWKELVSYLIVYRAHGRCEACGKRPDWRGLVGHHKIFRSKGRIDTAENCEILCGKCHSARHGVVESND